LRDKVLLWQLSSANFLHAIFSASISYTSVFETSDWWIQIPVLCFEIQLLEIEISLLSHNHLLFEIGYWDIF